MYILIALPVGKKLTLAKSARFALEPLSSWWVQETIFRSFSHKRWIIDFILLYVVLECKRND